MGFRRIVALVIIPTLLAPAAALAQQQPNSSTPAMDSRGDANSSDPPVSLDRIRRKLVASTRTTENKNGLKIQYYIEVYGRAPRIELFTKTENLTSAPVMYGGMTHQEFLNVVTPEEFKAPPADIGAAIAALIKWAAEKKNKK